MESFYHTLKTEHVYFETFSTKNEAISSIFEYIEASEVTPEVRLTLVLNGEMSRRRQLQSALGLKDNEHFRKNWLLPALDAKQRNALKL